jgi:hypothetical protein
MYRDIKTIFLLEWSTGVHLSCMVFALVCAGYTKDVSVVQFDKAPDYVGLDSEVEFY